MSEPTIFPLRPRFRELVWGGRGLETRFGKPLPAGRPFGESWEVSALPELESEVASGPSAGLTLGALVNTFGERLLGPAVSKRYGGRFPLLIKLLDACQDLSIQVHPDDAYASKNGLGTFGKSEAWYVLHSDNGRIALGLKEGVGRKAFEQAILKGSVADTIQYKEVQSGDFVYLPPGTIHALCKGVMIYEVQQSSNITFRIHDYDRPGLDGKPRELHTDRALEVIDFQSAPEIRDTRNESSSLLLETEHFSLEKFTLTSGQGTHTPCRSFAAATLIEGAADIRSGATEYPLEKGDTCLISANCPFEMVPHPETSVVYLVASVP